MNNVIRQLYTGVSWRSPVFNSVFRMMDIPDFLMRKLSGRSLLPPYSVRVRSRGVANQFGGKLFNEQGELMVSLLEKHASLTPSSEVVEIGCGCGCGAYGLSKYLTNGSYRGLDIDDKSIEFCLRSKAFEKSNFNFQLIDVFSSQWNPEGKISPENFELDIEDNSADVVFLTSVFTHMLPSAVSKYIDEAARILKPGGKLFTTVFLSDDGREGASINFPYEFEGCYLHQVSYPERGVAYPESFFIEEAANAGLKIEKPFEKGNWRVVRADGEEEENGFGQDIVVMTK